MPRKYTPLNKHKTHTEEDINKALQLIKDGMSLRVAADCSGIHYSVLYRHMKKGGEIKKKGGQTALSTEEEKILVDRIMICSEWGYPIDSVTLRLLVKEYLDRSGRKVKKFKDNLPGKDFVYSFLERYKSCLSFRMCQNIKRSRAGITPEVINEYFANLEKELKDVPRSNIVNYDETNLCDDPGKKKVITRRGCKYPERVMNSTKASTSVMFAAAGDGSILPPYVVYKAQHLYDSWREGGPANSRYNRTKSGWFDSFCFTDWVETVALPYFRRLDGVKFLIGDNLSSHLSVEVIKKCNESNVKFIFLPSNSTHLTQPLDVAFFRPLKMNWRAVLGDWKNGPGKYEATVPKDKFPSLLKKVFDSCKAENVVAGFKKCGIIPVDRQKVLDMLPGSTGNTTSTITGMPTVTIDDCLKNLLQQMREGDTPQPRKRRVRVSVAAGKSVEVKDFEDEHVDGPTHEKKTKSTTKKTDHSSSSSDSSSSSSSISDLDSETRSEEEESDKEPPNPELKFLPGEFAVSKVFGKTKDKFRMYVCKIVDYEEGGYVCQFYKKVPLVKKFTATDEESFVSKEDVIKKLNSPVAAASSSRFKDTITFDDDLTGLPIY